MAIVHLGAKRLQGTKLDRVVDSLGSSADGSNSGITLVKGGGSVTGSPTTDLSSAIGSWTKSPNSGSYFSVDSGNNEIDVAYGSSADHAISYDLGGGSNLGTKFTVRFEYQITGYSSLGNYMQFAVGLTDGTSSCIRNSSDLFVASNTAGSSLNRWRLHVDHSDQVSGGSGADSLQTMSTTSSATTYYIELTRDGDTFGLTFFTDNTYTTVSESKTGSTSETIDLRYLQASIYQESSGSGTYTSSIRNIKYWNNQARFHGSKLGSGCYSFDGSDDRVTTDQRVNGLHDGTGGSVVLWVNPTSSADNDIIFNTHNGSGSGVGVEIKFDSSNRIKVASTNSSNGWVTVNSTTALSNGTWYHVAVTLDTDTKYRIYINGTLEATSSAFTPKTANSTNPYYLGDSPDSGNYYDGVLDDVGIYSRVLSATEIGKLANNNVGGDSGWSKTSSNINIQNSRVNFDTTSGGSSTSALSYDIGTANIAGTWVLRGKSVITNYTVGGDGSSCHLFVGFSDKDHTTAFDGSQDSLSFAIGAGTNDDNYYIGSSNDGAMYSGSNHTNAQTTHEPTEETLYWELKRTGTQAATLTLYTDSGYSTSPSGYSKSITSFGGTPTNFRYLVFKSRDRSVSGSDCIGYIDDLKFWNDTTTASGTPDNTFDFNAGDAQLVSSLSNKAGLKAHYTMDSTSLTDASPTETTMFSTASGWSGDTSTWAYNSTISGIGCDTSTVGEAVVKSLGTQLSNSGKWVARFKLTRNSGDQGDGIMLNFGSASASTSSLARMQNDDYPYGIHVYIANNGDLYFAAHNTSFSWDGSSNGSGKSLSTGSSVYVEIQHHSATSATVKFHDNSDYSDSPTSQTRTWSGQTLNYDDIGLGTKWSNNNKNVDLEDFEVWVGVDKLSGLVNDASATSDLHAMTNLPVNTIFEQIDDTLSYWWKQSDNTWKLDGTSVTFSDDFSTTKSGWTFTDTAKVGVTDGKMLFDSVHDNSYDGASYDLGTALSDTLWVMRFKWTIDATSGSGSNGCQGFIGMSASPLWDGSTPDRDIIGLSFVQNSNTLDRIMIASDRTNNPMNFAQSSGRYSDVALAQQTYYVQIQRTGALTSTVKISTTDAHDGDTFSKDWSTSQYGSSNEITDLKYIWIQAQKDSGGATFTTSIDDMEIINGRSTWIE